jgi:hypothetical protein
MLPRNVSALYVASLFALALLQFGNPLAQYCQFAYELLFSEEGKKDNQHGSPGSLDHQEPALRFGIFTLPHTTR